MKRDNELSECTELPQTFHRSKQKLGVKIVIRKTSLIAQLVKNLPVMQETLVWFLGRKICWRRDRLPTPGFLGFPMAQLVKNPPAVWETWIWSLGWEDLLDKGKATHSSILAWRIPWTMLHGVTKSWRQLSNFHFHFEIFINLFKLMILSGCINRVVSFFFFFDKVESLFWP